MMFILTYDAYFLWSSKPPESMSATATPHREGDAAGEEEEEAESMPIEGEKCPEQADNQQEQFGIGEHLAAARVLGYEAAARTANNIQKKATENRLTKALQGGAVDIVVFFFQMAMLVMPGIRGFLYVITNFLSRMLNLQWLTATSSSSNDGMICLAPDTTDFGTIAGTYVVPLMMFLGLLAMCQGYWLYLKCQAQVLFTGHKNVEQHRPASDGQSQNINPASLSYTLNSDFYEEAEAAHSDSSDEDDAIGSKTKAKSLTKSLLSSYDNNSHVSSSMGRSRGRDRGTDKATFDTATSSKYSESESELKFGSNSSNNNPANYNSSSSSNWWSPSLSRHNTTDGSESPTSSLANFPTTLKNSWRRMEYRRAAVSAQLGLFAYSSVTNTTFQLIRCEQVQVIQRMCYVIAVYHFVSSADFTHVKMN